MLQHGMLLVVLAVIYYLAGKFGLQLAFLHASASPVWPPTGIAIASFLIFGYRIWPAILVGAFFVNITTQGSVPVVLGISTGNMLEGLIGAYLVNRYANGRDAFNHPHDVIVFAVFACMASPAVSATMGVTSLALGGFAEWSNFGPIWLTWWTGDAVGGITVGSLLVLLQQRQPVYWNRTRFLERLLLTVSLAGTGFMVFGGILIDATRHYPLEFLCVPFLIWAAFRFTQIGAAAGSLFFSAIAIWGTLQGYGPFVRLSENEALLTLQLFIGITTLTAMTLAAALAERKKSEEHLMRAHAMLRQKLFQTDTSFRQLIENVRDYAIFLISPTGTIMSWNSGAQHIKGYSAGEIVGRNFSVFYTPEDQRAHKPMRLLHAAAAQGRVEDEGWRVRKNGDRYWADVVITALRSEQGELTGFIKVARDMTDRRQAELAKSSFISAASHQLRTPLSAMLWNLELLKDDGKFTEAQRGNLLTDTMKQGQYMSEIIETMLRLTRIEEEDVSIRTADVRVRSLFQQMEKIHKHALVRGQLTLTTSCPSDLSLRTDPNILTEILSNLVVNAIRYTPPGGLISMAATSDDHTITFTVTDTGIGIPDKEKGRIFERFFRASNARAHIESGTGLGLFLAKTLVTLSGGTIDFTSRLRKGTAFRFTIPMERPQPKKP